MDHDPYDSIEEDRKRDMEKAKPHLEDFVLQQKAATERELKVRLEKDFFPWVVSRALVKMEDDGMINRMGYPGRTNKKFRMPETFCVPYGTAWADVASIIEKKRNTTRLVNAILTAHAPAGSHAENLFDAAFRSLDFEIRIGMHLFSEIKR